MIVWAFNVTNNNTSNMKVNEQLSFAIVVMEIIFLVLVLYLMISLSYAGWKTPSQERSKNKKKGLLFALVLIYTILTAAKCAFALWVYYVPLSLASTHHCMMVTIFYQSVNITGSIALYLFLWLRQYTLYQEPVLNHLVSPCIIRFSRSLLVIICVFGITAVVGVTRTNFEENFKVIEGTNACAYVSKNMTFNGIIIYTGSALVILTQGCILFLFIHILRLHQNSAATSRRHSRRRSSATYVRVRLLVRNCAIAAGISTLSDITAVVLNGVFLSYSTQLMIHGMWDIDCFINLACTIFCFSNWKEIIQPWRKTNEINESNFSSSAGLRSSGDITLDRK